MKTKKILIIDDDITFLKLMTEALKKNKKNKIFTAEEGEKGFEVTKKEKPDIVLLDLIMPKLDGIEYLKLLRGDKDEDIKYMPVFVVTQIGDVNKVAEATRYSIKGYFVKSNTDLGEIVKKIDEII